MKGEYFEKLRVVLQTYYATRSEDTEFLTFIASGFMILGEESMESPYLLLNKYLSVPIEEKDRTALLQLSREDKALLENALNPLLNSYGIRLSGDRRRNTRRRRVYKRIKSRHNRKRRFQRGGVLRWILGVAFVLAAGIFSAHAAVPQARAVLDLAPRVVGDLDIYNGNDPMVGYVPPMVPVPVPDPEDPEDQEEPEEPEEPEEVWPWYYSEEDDKAFKALHTLFTNYPGLLLTGLATLSLVTFGAPEWLKEKLQIMYTVHRPLTVSQTQLIKDDMLANRPVNYDTPNIFIYRGHGADVLEYPLVYIPQGSKYVNRGVCGLSNNDKNQMLDTIAMSKLYNGTNFVHFLMKDPTRYKPLIDTMLGESIPTIKAYEPLGDGFNTAEAGLKPVDNMYNPISIFDLPASKQVLLSKISGIINIKDIPLFHMFDKNVYGYKYVDDSSINVKIPVKDIVDSFKYSVYPSKLVLQTELSGIIRKADGELKPIGGTYDDTDHVLFGELLRLSLYFERPISSLLMLFPGVHYNFTCRDSYSRMNSRPDAARNGVRGNIILRRANSYGTGRSMYDLIAHLYVFGSFNDIQIYRRHAESLSNEELHKILRLPMNKSSDMNNDMQKISFIESIIIR